MKNINKKFALNFIAAAVCIFALLMLNVSAEENVTYYPTGTFVEGVNLGAVEAPRSGAGDGISLMAAADFEEYLVSQCLLHKEEIVVWDFKIDMADINDLWYEISMKHPEALIKTTFSFNYVTGTSYVYALFPFYYTESARESVSVWNQISDGIDGYIAAADNCEGIVEKLTVIHDLIIRDCEYDTDATDSQNNVINWDSFHSYGLFKNQKMVCQGYSQLFYTICKRLGIEAGFCESDYMNHIWNYVCIDGKWYHADVTWDDPVFKNADGQVDHKTTAMHKYFLISDTAMAASHHEKSTWKSYMGFMPDCEDTFYQSNHLFNLPFGVTIEYDGEMFKAPYDYRCFTSKTLYTGRIVTTELTDSGTRIVQYSMCLTDMDKPLDLIVAVKPPDGTLFKVRLNHKDTGNPRKTNVIYQDMFTKPSDMPENAEVSFFWWETGTVNPFTSKKSIVGGLYGAEQ